jgi:hypothetical protein
MATKKDIHHPSNFLFFDTETKDQRKNKTKGKEHHTLWFGWVWAFRYEEQNVTRSMKQSFNTTAEFYELVHQRLDPSRPLYIFAHNLGFDLTIVDFWEQQELKGMQCLYAVLEDPPLFLSYRWDDCKIILIDTFNFWKCSVADMGKSLGIDKLQLDITKATREQADPYCIRDVEIIANQVTNLLDFLTDNDLGSFGISAPAIAMNTFKKRFMSHQIFIHDRTKVLELERQAYYGGLVNNFYLGKSKGETLWHVDVNSLYPSVMRAPYPAKLIESWQEPAKWSILFNDLTKGYVADVLIHSQKDTYPKRHNGRLCEVSGRFRTQLCGPELVKAIRRNHVRHVYSMAQYEMKPVFSDYVEYFWHMRQLHSQPKGNPREQLIKLLMNSLYGKFGMKGFDWVDFTTSNLEAYYDLIGVPMPDLYKKDEATPVVNGHTAEWYPLGLDHAVKIRYLSGKLQFKFPTGEHSESFCAIAAFVTSYARERLRQLIQIAGIRNTYYCDTDSLFVNQVGFSNLTKANEIDSSQLGKLKLEGQSKIWAFYGPKDYTFGDKNVMKGIRKNAKKIAPQTYEQLQFEGLKSVLNRGGEGYIVISTQQKTIKRKYAKGITTQSGWTMPFSLQE